jgi:hypothetical protein
MIILCAWCEREGRPAVLYKTLHGSSSSWEVHSHGICKAHSDRLLSEMQVTLAECMPSTLASIHEVGAVQGKTVPLNQSPAPTA